MVAGVPKRLIRPYFYKFRLGITYGKIKLAVAACVADTALPKGVAAADLVKIKRSLENYRKQQGTTIPSAVEAERALLETAAEMGDRTAIALLCKARLSDKAVSPEDWTDGSNLLRELMDMRFPLAFKVSGDLAYAMGRAHDAKRLYELALSHGIQDPSLRTECWRSIGHIAFKDGDLEGALAGFSTACQLAPELSQVGDCHFYLAQLREANREASRAHLQRAASLGLSDAFLPLGMLLLNYFGETKLAKHWLDLALVTDTTGSAAVGLLDVSRRLKDPQLEQEALSRMRAHPNAAELLKSRKTEQKAEQPTLDRWSFAG